MALLLPIHKNILLNNQQILRSVLISSVRYKQRNHITDNLVEHHRQSPLGKAKAGAAVGEFPPKNDKEKDLPNMPNDFKYMYPDFLPSPIPYLRDRLLEKLERRDMFRRRQQIDIPEFYVGSVLAITSADPYAPNRRNRFVGICISRERHGLKHQFTLRNIVDGLGVEITYELYNPTITKIEVLKLERRLDNNLAYLRDAAPEHCTFPFDMEPVKLPPGAAVPLNTIQVPITKKNWQYKWERYDLKGVLLPQLPRSVRKATERFAEPWRRWDIMRHYREEIHDDDRTEIYQDIEQHKKDLAQYRMDSKENVKIVRARPKASGRKALPNNSNDLTSSSSKSN